MNSSSIPISDDLRALIDREMREGGFASTDELLRQVLSFWAEHRESVTALDRAIDDMDASRIREWNEFEVEFRARNDLR